MKKLKYLLLLLILSFFGINQVSAKDISLEDLVKKINSNNYGDYYIGQLKENYTDMYMISIASIDYGDLFVDGNMAPLSDPYDYITDYIHGTLNNSILSFYIYFDLEYGANFDLNATEVF
ncbi:MAG: hypothetical protein PHX04_03555 [Bacilli bacterium]|nr:hypothetical protein [Bacilli bacterium]